MTRRTLFWAALWALLMAFVLPSSSRADSSSVKCAPNEERVWVYDSVTTLNVAAKLKCGDNVEVIGQENGYAKIRMANGTEGYVPVSNLPKLPANLPSTASAPAQAEPPSLASLARAAAAARRASIIAAAPVNTATVAPAPTPASVPPQPSVAVNAAPAAEAKPTTPVAAAPVKAASAAVTPVSTTASTAAAPMPASAHAAPAVAVSHPKAKAAAKPASTTVTTSAKPAPANPPTPRATPSASASAPVHTAVVTPAAKAPSAQPATANDVYVGGVVNANATPKAATVRTVADTSEDDDDSYLNRPVSESDDPSCQTYFSGYGLSPGQFKWLADNRRKKYPSICPAASPAMVDYVIIFTHDVDFFNYTMPTPVHTEAGGFSDWTPILEFDTSVISHSDIDKSKREYVWVFHVKRGAFDPAKFSPHRRFQYNKIESKYTRTVEDAFDFIQGQGSSQ
jgi:hypothetical protein